MIETRIFCCITFAAILLAIPYRVFLSNVGFKFGIANLDMQYYMSLAEQIQDMPLRDGFKTISQHWNFLSVNPVQMWGYRIYIYFLVLCIFKRNIFPVVISVYMVSILQVLIGEYAMLISYNSLKYKKLISHTTISLIMMLSSPAVWYGCVRLLREWMMILCMGVAIKEIAYKEEKWKTKILVAALLLFVLRPYYVLFLIPVLLIIQGENKKACLLSSLLLFIMLGICVIRRTGIISVVGVFLSPNFFSQVRHLTVSAVEVAKSSGQIQIINYIGAVWNLIVLLYVLLAVCFTKRLNLIAICCVELIFELSMIYAISFGGATELRHKIFFVIPYILILNNGFWPFTKGKKCLAINIMIWCAIVVYTCIAMLI